MKVFFKKCFIPIPRRNDDQDQSVLRLGQDQNFEELRGEVTAINSNKTFKLGAKPQSLVCLMIVIVTYCAREQFTWTAWKRYAWAWFGWADAQYDR